jgi:hypothetical protein
MVCSIPTTFFIWTMIKKFRQSWQQCISCLIWWAPLVEGQSSAPIANNIIAALGLNSLQQSGPMGFFLGRNHTFVIHRRSAADVDVWLEDDPGNKATVRLLDGADRLRVASTAGSTAFVRGNDTQCTTFRFQGWH